MAQPLIRVFQIIFVYFQVALSVRHVNDSQSDERLNQYLPACKPSSLTLRFHLLACIQLLRRPDSRDKSPVENFAEQMRVAVAVFSHIQIVVEKLARQHGGERGRRYAITCLEALKAVSRLLLLACTREMVIGGGAVSTHIYGTSEPLMRCCNQSPLSRRGISAKDTCKKYE